MGIPTDELEHVFDRFHRVVWKNYGGFWDWRLGSAADRRGSRRKDRGRERPRARVGVLRRIARSQRGDRRARRVLPVTYRTHAGRRGRRRSPRDPRQLAGGLGLSATTAANGREAL